MNALLWMLGVMLAATYAVTGASKVVAPRERLPGVPGMGWIEQTPMPRVRLIGAREIAGAIGVVVPWATGILSILTPLAAWALAAVQVGAIWTHVSRSEREHLWLNELLLVVAVVVAIGRTIPWAERHSTHLRRPDSRFGACGRDVPDSPVRFEFRKPDDQALWWENLGCLARPDGDNVGSPQPSDEPKLSA